MKREIMKKITAWSISLLMLNTTVAFAVLDVEQEIYAPAAEMKMLDDAMNRGIEEQRQRNASKPMIIEDDASFNAPMLEFILDGDEYRLEKRVTDVSNTKIKTKLENRMLTVTEIKKIEEVVIEDSVTLGSSSTKKEYFESTTSETLSLPHDADEKTFESHYENGLLQVKIKKK